MDKEIEATAKEILNSLKIKVKIDIGQNDSENIYEMKGTAQEIEALSKALDSVARLLQTSEKVDSYK